MVLMMVIVMAMMMVMVILMAIMVMNILMSITVRMVSLMVVAILVRTTMASGASNERFMTNINMQVLIQADAAADDDDDDDDVGPDSHDGGDDRSGAVGGANDCREYMHDDWDDGGRDSDDASVWLCRWS